MKTNFLVKKSNNDLIRYQLTKVDVNKEEAAFGYEEKYFCTRFACTILVKEGKLSFNCEMPKFDYSIEEVDLFKDVPLIIASIANYTFVISTEKNVKKIYDYNDLIPLPSKRTIDFTQLSSGLVSGRQFSDILGNDNLKLFPISTQLIISSFLTNLYQEIKCDVSIDKCMLLILN